MSFTALGKSNRAKFTPQPQVTPGDVVVPATLIGTGSLQPFLPHPLSDVGYVPPNEEPSSVDEPTLLFFAFSLKDPRLGIILVPTSPFPPCYLPPRGILYVGAWFVFSLISE